MGLAFTAQLEVAGQGMEGLGRESVAAPKGVIWIDYARSAVDRQELLTRSAPRGKDNRSH